MSTLWGPNNRRIFRHLQKYRTFFNACWRGILMTVIESVDLQTNTHIKSKIYEMRPICAPPPVCDFPSPPPFSKLEFPRSSHKVLIIRNQTLFYYSYALRFLVLRLWTHATGVCLSWSVGLQSQWGEGGEGASSREHFCLLARCWPEFDDLYFIHNVSGYCIRRIGSALFTKEM